MNALKGREEKLLELLSTRATIEDVKKRICKKSCQRQKTLPPLKDWKDEEYTKRDAAIVEQEDRLPPGMQSYNANDILSMSESDQMAWFADQERKKQLREMREAEM